MPIKHMSESTTRIEKAAAVYEERLSRGGEDMLLEADAFFMRRGDLYRVLRDLTHRLEEAGIPYAIIGGIALAQHGFARLTQDIDMLLTKDGLAEFRERFLGRGYVPAFPNAAKTFRSADAGVRIEIITAGEYPGDGRPKSVSFPDPESAVVEIDGMRIIRLDRLVELKLASGMTAPHRRRDLADVQDLICALELPLAFAERLDSSVGGLYRQLWAEVQTPDELQNQ